MKFIDKAKKLFFGDKSKNIFGHKADGEACSVCGNPMHTKQGITMVGSGEKMHQSCWPDFFRSKLNSISNGDKQ
ncbi:hypothetical protein [Vibrio phage H188]|nr:hypothetical protein [Vibrio phage H188]